MSQTDLFPVSIADHHKFPSAERRVYRTPVALPTGLFLLSPLEELQHVGHLFHGHIAFDSFGHQRLVCGLQFFDITARNRLLTTFGLAKCDGVCRFCNHQAVQQSSVSCDHDVLCILRVNSAVRIQHVVKQSISGTCASITDVRADVVADSSNAVTFAAGFFEDGGSASYIPL